MSKNPLSKASEILNFLVAIGIKPTRISLKLLNRELFLCLKFNGSNSRILRIDTCLRSGLDIRYRGKYRTEIVGKSILVNLKMGCPTTRAL